MYLTAEEENIQDIKEILENEEIKKISYNITKTYILLKQVGIDLKGINYDIAIASYILNPTNNKLELNRLIEQYLGLDVLELIEEEQEQKQINLFDTIGEQTNIKVQEKYTLYSYAIHKIKEATLKELEQIGALELFYDIDMPTVEVLSNMQWNGMYIDKEELEQFGKELTEKLETITKIIYEMAGEEFNINSTKQLRRNPI